MEMIPRITRAQSMDALSSQSNIAGYKAVLLAAAALPKFFPMLTTAAGTIPPAKVLVLGAGVAGLQAIATARRLGAVVSGYDVRAAVKEQIQSLGATFLEFDLGADAEGAGGYAKELTPEQQERQRAWMVEQIGAQRRRDHDGARARTQGAGADQRSGRRRDETGQRHRGSRRRGRRKLRAHRSPTRSSRRPTA